MFRLSQSPKSCLLGVFAIGLIIRVLFAWKADPTLKNDEIAYVEVATNVLATGSYVSTGDLAVYGIGEVRPPLLPWLIMLIFHLVGPNIFILRVLLAALASLITIEAAILARHLGALPRCSIACAVAAALHPSLAYDASRVLTEGLFAVLIGGLMVLIAAPHWRQNTVRAVMTGAVMGLALLCRPTILLFAPILAMVWLVYAPKGQRWFGVIATVMAMLTILPWEASLYRRHHAIIPICLSGGLNVWYANNDVLPGRVDVTPRPAELLAYLQTLPEVERDRYYRTMAIDWMKRNPRLFWVARTRALLEFWRTWPADLWNQHLSLEEAYGVSLPVRTQWMIVMAKLGWFATQTIVLISAFTFGANRTQRNNPVIMSVAGLFIAVTAVHSITAVSYRYRHPFDPIWMTLGIVGLCRTLPLWARPSAFGATQERVGVQPSQRDEPRD